MAKFSVIYAHLNQIYVRSGDKLKLGKKLGEMGNTGYSFGNHLHLGVNHGVWHKAFYSDDIRASNALENECLKFREGTLFTFRNAYQKAWLSANDDGTVNSYWHRRSGGRFHKGLDFITDDSHRGNLPDIHWNRNYTGTVTATGNDENITSYGYGKFVVVTYDTSEVLKDNSEALKEKKEEKETVKEKEDVKFNFKNGDIVEIDKKGYELIEKYAHRVVGYMHPERGEAIVSIVVGVPEKYVKKIK